MTAFHRTAMAMVRKSRVLVCGAGRMGHIRAQLIRANPRFELAGIVDASVENGRHLAGKLNTSVFPSITDATTKDKPTSPLDAVVLSTPTFTHSELIHEAALLGLPVFTEKPVDETAEKIAELFRVADAASIPLCCSFQRRFDKSYVTCTEAVHQGLVGTPVSAQIFFGDHPVPPAEFLKQGGCIFMDLLAHDVDFILHTLQDQVVSVYATGTSSDVEQLGGVYDNATVVLNLTRGTSVTLFLSRGAVYGYDQRATVFGTTGQVAVNNVPEHATVISNATGIHHARLTHSFPQRFEQAFGAELQAFADVLQEGATWPVSASQCIAVQRVADAAAKSAAMGCVVALETTTSEREASATALL